mmetsp:Transcript_20701/g.63367  ORF Transcript_20701/g.63367 Transcript_20701/m.63367 type:complete len:337 (+) Transcript_20701:1254-2264(+)|eukprot:scaffold203514_cov32-Tisochrysis_lutea.AAC.1
MSVTEGCAAMAHTMNSKLITMTTTPRRLAITAVRPTHKIASAAAPTARAQAWDWSGAPRRKARPRPPPERLPAWSEALPNPRVSTASPRRSSRIGQGSMRRIASPSPDRETAPSRADISCNTMHAPMAIASTGSSARPNSEPACEHVAIEPGPMKAAAIASPGPHSRVEGEGGVPTSRIDLACTLSLRSRAGSIRISWSHTHSVRNGGAELCLLVFTTLNCRPSTGETERACTRTGGVALGYASSPASESSRTIPGPMGSRGGSGGERSAAPSTGVGGIERFSRSISPMSSDAGRGSCPLIERKICIATEPPCSAGSDARESISRAEGGRGGRRER